MSGESHWQQVYSSKATDSVSWYRPHLDRSLAFIDALALAPADPILDVGAGASTLVDDLLARGFQSLTLNDIADAALAHTRARLAAAGVGGAVRFACGDITSLDLPGQHFALWHDRAVFHFLTDAGPRAAYVAHALRAVRSGGHLLIATFAPDGPERCSGLPVRRYDAASLANEFGPAFTLIDQAREQHPTPSGATQSFQYALLRRH